MSRGIGAWTASLLGSALLVAGGAGLVEGAREDAVKVTVGCPTALPASGGTLTVGLTLVNATAQPQIIARSGLGVHVGGLDVLGPFVVPLSVTLVPFQTQAVPSYLSSPYTSGAAHPGTFITVAVMVLDGTNKVLGSGYCLIQMQ